VLVGTLAPSAAVLRPGLARSTRRLLRAGVALLGLQLAVAQVLGFGLGVLLAVVMTVAVAFAGTLWIAGMLGVSRGLRILVAAGFSICGASAVAAVSAVVDHEDDDVATAIGLFTGTAISIGSLANAGPRALALGGLSGLLLAGTSLAALRVLGP
jgi:uncharacterized membrane protein YadS